MPSAEDIAGTPGEESGPSRPSVFNRSQRFPCNLMKLLSTSALLVLLVLSAAAARAQVYVVSGVNNNVGTYDPVTGATLNANLITGLSGPDAITIARGSVYVATNTPDATNRYSLTGAPLAIPFISGYGADLEITGDDVFMPTFFQTVGKFTSSGTVVDDTFITSPALLDHPGDIVRSGNTLYITVEGNGSVATYNATTGTAINTSFITGLSSPASLALVNNVLYVANFGSDSIGVYNATTGVVINASFITGLNDPVDLAVFGGFLYVANRNSGQIGKYDANSGATVDASFISVTYPTAVAVAFDKSTAIDLGVISTTTTTTDYATADRTVSVEIASAKEVIWYRFNVPENADLASARFLDIATLPNLPSTLVDDDTEIGLYDSNGTLVATNDDGGVGAYSQLSFNPNVAPRSPLTAVGFTTDAAAAGQNGVLAAGTYYLAVAPWQTSFSPEFNVASETTDTGTFRLEFRTDMPRPNSAPTVAVSTKSLKPTTKARVKIGGTCADPDGDALKVFVKVGKSGFRPAKVTGSKWSSSAKLEVGKNALQVYSMDGGGLRSATKRFKITRLP